MLLDNNKILYVFSTQIRSGAEIVMERMIIGNLGNIEPIIIAPPGPIINNYRCYNIETIEEYLLYPIKILRNKHSTILFYTYRILIISYHIFKILKKNKIRIVHCNNLGAAISVFPLVIINKIFSNNIRYIWTDHDNKYINKIKYYVAKICAIFFNKTIIVSRALYKEKYHNMDKKVKILYNGIDIDKFKPDHQKRKLFRQQMNISDEQIIIGIIGLIKRSKGHDILIRCFNKLIKSNVFSMYRLLIVGDIINDEDLFENEVKYYLSLLPKDSYHILPFQNDITYFYNGIDILVNTSSSTVGESLGTTIYESMAFKKIALASNVGGSKEIINDGYDGFLFMPDNEIDLFDKLVYIYNNYNMMDSIRINARETVKLRFSLDNMIKGYLKIIYNL
jgi:glycosyltransferase involved in cell wall biosynthesis